MIIDHVGLTITDYQRSKTFYSNILAPLGIDLIMEHDGWAGFGKLGRPEFWLQTKATIQKGLHIAFKAYDCEAVDAFYYAALSAGGKDNGPPGLREIIHPHYYAAYVIDCEGYNIEAVCHTANRKR